MFFSQLQGVAIVVLLMTRINAGKYDLITKHQGLLKYYKRAMMALSRSPETTAFQRWKLTNVNIFNIKFKHRQ
jgi:hypothetical protein